MTNELVAFLRARLDEDERDPGGWSATRVLAEVDAKRRIIGWADSPALPEYECRYVLDALSLPYRDHPDYQPEWMSEA